VIFQDEIPDLLDLIGFPLSAFGLEIENLLNTIHEKNMVIALDSFTETKPFEQCTQRFERDVRIRSTHQYMFEELFQFSHRQTLSFPLPCAKDPGSLIVDCRRRCRSQVSVKMREREKDYRLSLHWIEMGDHFPSAAQTHVPCPLCDSGTWQGNSSENRHIPYCIDQPTDFQTLIFID
jgi:hypothetical protein